MKKILIALLVVGLMVSVSLAAKAPVAKAASASESGMKIGVGVESTPISSAAGLPLAGLNMATMRFIGDSFSGSAGLLFQTASGGGVSGTAIGFGGKYTFNLTGGTVPTHAGAGLTYISYQALAAGTPTTSGFTLAGIYGAETIINDHLNIGVDIYPISFTSVSTAGASTTVFSVLSGTVYAAYLF